MPSPIALPSRLYIPIHPIPAQIIPNMCVCVVYPLLNHAIYGVFFAGREPSTEDVGLRHLSLER